MLIHTTVLVMGLFPAQHNIRISSPGLLPRPRMHKLGPRISIMATRRTALAHTLPCMHPRRRTPKGMEAHLALSPICRTLHMELSRTRLTTRTGVENLTRLSGHSHLTLFPIT